MAGFETIIEHKYKYPRYAHRETIDGSTTIQHIGDVEVSIWRAEWVKASRINDLIRSHFPQSSDEDYIVIDQGVPEQILEGHDLFNITVRAQRFVKSNQMADAHNDWLQRSVQ